MRDVNKVQKRAERKALQVVPFEGGVEKSAPPLLSRHAFKMKLKPGFKEEYQRRHEAIWPELSQVLSAAGISDYSIYLDEETNTLFALQKLSPNHTADRLPHDPIVRKWWDFMSDVMEYNDDNAPVAITREEMFNMD